MHESRQKTGTAMKQIKDWELFRFTDKNGKMKSGTLVYSFSFAMLFLIVYGGIYYFAIDLLDPLTKSLPVWASDVIAAILPAMVGAVLCALPMKIIEAKKAVPLAYIWLAAFAIVFLIMMTIMLWEDKDALSIFLRLFLLMVPAPIVIGGGLADKLYRYGRKKRGEEDD